MTFIATLFLLAAALILPAPSTAQPARQLSGRVELVDSAGNPDEPGANVSVAATVRAGQLYGAANSFGLFRINLPPGVRGGDQITFQVDKQGYRILRPHGGIDRVPSEPQRDQIILVLAPRGSAVFLSGDAIYALLQRAAEADRDRTDPSGEAPRLRYYIERWAIEYGFSAAQVEEQVDAWVRGTREKPEDTFQAGLAAYVENQLSEAADLFRESGEQNEIILQEVSRRRIAVEAEERKYRERVIRDYRLQGDALLYSEDFSPALAAFQRARLHASRDRDPVLWAEVQNDLGRAHRALATVSEGAAIREHLDQGMAFHDSALLVLTRESNVLQWAQTHLHRGNTLSFYAAMEYGPTARAQATEALASFWSAYQAFQQANSGLGVLQSMIEIGDVLGQLSELASGEQADSLTALSIAAYEAILSVIPRNELPREWEEARARIVSRRRSLAARSERAHAKSILEGEIAALREIMDSAPTDTSGVDAIDYRQDLAGALASLAALTPTDSAVLLLRQARETIEGTASPPLRERDPHAWAAAQALNGSIELELGRHDSAGADQAWRNALRFFQAAQTYYTRETFPEFWASLQISVSATLLRHARIQPRATALETLDQARYAVDTALELEGEPVGIAICNFNVGIITMMQGNYPAAESAYVRARPDIPLRARADLDVAVLALRSAIDFQGGRLDSIPIRLQQIIDLVAEQESSYYIEQSVRGGHLFIHSADVAPTPEQAWLVEYFSAFQAPNRDMLLADLRALQRRLSTAQARSVPEAAMTEPEAGAPAGSELAGAWANAVEASRRS